MNPILSIRFLINLIVFLSLSPTDNPFSLPTLREIFRPMVNVMINSRGKCQITEKAPPETKIPKVNKPSVFSSFILMPEAGLNLARLYGGAGF